VRLKLTRAGRAVAERAREVANRVNRRILKGVDEQEARAALKVLVRAADALIAGADDTAHAVLSFSRGGKETG
jgi:DNA-binding MarR family transcriptional regulator